ncbi:MAG: hypothetical protein ACYTEX_27625, partial [Planctomycetota bacterium]
VLVLTLYGKMTASSKAAAAQVSVTAATLEAGVAASVAAALVGKGTVTALAAAGAVTVGSVALSNRPPAVSQGPQVKSFAPNGAAVQRTNGLEECWYYFPDGVAGPVMTRWTTCGSRRENSYCQWLQNDTGNFYFDKKKNIAYRVNHRMWNEDLTVRSLPTDEPPLTEFLATVQGEAGKMEHVYFRGRGLLVVAQRDKGQSGGYWRIIRHHNVLEEDYFRCDWPTGSRMVDKRDRMHSLGWAYMRIEGEIAGQRLRGRGQIPLVYEACKRYEPWLRLKVAESLEIVDSTEGASILGAGGKVLGTYPAGSFFKGLAQPWMGLHTIDTVRRDAARQQLRFETELDGESGKSEVTVFCSGGKLVYTINMESDVIDKIAFDVNGRVGELRFSYTNDIDRRRGDHSAPRIRSRSAPLGKSDGPLWLLRLAAGDLGKD